MVLNSSAKITLTCFRPAFDQFISLGVHLYFIMGEYDGKGGIPVPVFNSRVFVHLGHYQECSLARYRFPWEHLDLGSIPLSVSNF